jgi:hypothetical protein
VRWGGGINRGARQAQPARSFFDAGAAAMVAAPASGYGEGMAGLRRRRGLALWATAFAVVALATAEACGFDEGGELAAVPLGSGDASGDGPGAALPEAAVPDAQEGGRACPPPSTSWPDAGERQVFAVRHKPPIMVDAGPADAATDAADAADGAAADAGDAASDAGDAGDAGDAAVSAPDTSAWRGCTSFVLDRTTAAAERRDDADASAQATARIALEWDEAALYVAVDIDDATLEGSSATPYLNDSFEIYASGFGVTRTGDYTSLDHHVIADHRGLSLDYSVTTSPVPYPSHVVRTPSGYRVEMTIGASALGGQLGAGQTLFVDALLNDGKGTTAQRKFLVWALTPHAACTCTKCSCNSEPAFDTLFFAPFTLVE